MGNQRIFLVSQFCMVWTRSFNGIAYRRPVSTEPHGSVQLSIERNVLCVRSCGWTHKFEPYRPRFISSRSGYHPGISGTMKGVGLDPV